MRTARTRYGATQNSVEVIASGKPHASRARHREKQDELGRPSSGQDRSHPIPIGETVFVMRLIDENRATIEGRAEIKATAQQPNFYRVQFVGDPQVRERFVHICWQSNPDDFIAALCGLWHASRQSIGHQEFFPDRI